jgi:hypothetical protein
MGEMPKNRATFAACARLSAPFHLNPLFTAADAKIALSIGQVNNKPQYVVFFGAVRFNPSNGRKPQKQ